MNTPKPSNRFDTPITEDNLHKFLIVQEKEIENRTLQLKNEEQKILINKDIAIKSIEAQRDFEKEKTSAFCKIYKWRLIVFVIFSVIVTSLIIGTALLGKEELAKDIIHYICIIAGSYFSGLYIGAKGKRSSKKDDSSDE